MISKKAKSPALIKLIVFLILFITFVILGRYFDLPSLLNKVFLFIDELSWSGLLLYIGLYVLGSIMLVPGSILSAGAGFLFGLGTGLWLSPVASLFGVTAAFLMGRYLARDWTSTFIGSHPKLRRIDNAVGRDGWRIVWLLRLTPLTPINFLNYFLGVTRVSLKDYVSASFFGMLPLNILYAYIGSFTGNLATLSFSEMFPKENQTLNLTLYGLGFITTLAAVIYIAHFAKKNLKKSIYEE